MKKIDKSKSRLLKAMDHTRERSHHCRAIVFRDKSKYDRKREKARLRSEIRKELS